MCPDLQSRPAEPPWAAQWIPGTVNLQKSVEIGAEDLHTVAGGADMHSSSPQQQHWALDQLLADAPLPPRPPTPDADLDAPQTDPAAQLPLDQLEEPPLPTADGERLHLWASGNHEELPAEVPGSSS